MCVRWLHDGMTRRSASRGILYTAPPADTDTTAEETETADVDQAATEAPEPAAADD